MKRLKIILGMTVIAACLAACSSTPAAVATTPTDAGGSALNPEGVPYPSPAGGYGRTARIGTTPGSVIQNFKFQGILAGQTAVSTISLADYYDPCNKHNKILHISVAAVWCQPCAQETTTVVADLAAPATSLLDQSKIVFIQALDEGPTPGLGATLTDLNSWITENHSNFTEMIDPELANFGGFFDAASLPWNTDIDVRTMEILDSDTGWDGDLGAKVSVAVAALPATPSYSIPASAGCAN
jgi:hypothetical protein